ncbi:hypothetical protein MTO96_013431 [Rhipicephalus appendiculatus]
MKQPPANLWTTLDVRRCSRQQIPGPHRITTQDVPGCSRQRTRGQHRSCQGTDASETLDCTGDRRIQPPVNHWTAMAVPGSNSKRNPGPHGRSQHAPVSESPDRTGCSRMQSSYPPAGRVDCCGVIPADCAKACLEHF